MRRTHRLRPVGKFDLAQGGLRLLLILWIVGEVQVAWLRSIQP